MSYCKKCKQQIQWGKTSNNKWVPLNLDGTNHFDTCPYANEFRGRNFRNSNIDYSRVGLPKDQKTLT